MSLPDDDAKPEPGTDDARSGNSDESREDERSEENAECMIEQRHRKQSPGECGKCLKPRCQDASVDAVRVFSMRPFGSSRISLLYDWRTATKRLPSHLPMVKGWRKTAQAYPLTSGFRKHIK